MRGICWHQGGLTLWKSSACRQCCPGRRDLMFPLWPGTQVGVPRIKAPSLARAMGRVPRCGEACAPIQWVTPSGSTRHPICTLYCSISLYTASSASATVFPPSPALSDSQPCL